MNFLGGETERETAEKNTWQFKCTIENGDGPGDQYQGHQRRQTGGALPFGCAESHHVPLQLGRCAATQEEGVLEKRRAMIQRRWWGHKSETKIPGKYRMDWTRTPTRNFGACDIVGGGYTRGDEVILKGRL